MSRLFAGTSFDMPPTCEFCSKTYALCTCPPTPRGKDGKILLPKDQAVRVRREKRRGKITTVISGLDPSANDLPAMLKKFKASLGAGGTVTGDHELELQGDHKDKLIATLKGLGFAGVKGAGG